MTRDELHGTSKEQDNRPGAARPVEAQPAHAKPALPETPLPAGTGL